jgi:hypothetical protein
VARTWAVDALLVVVAEHAALARSTWRWWWCRLVAVPAGGRGKRQGWCAGAAPLVVIALVATVVADLVVAELVASIRELCTTGSMRTRVPAS